MVCCFFVVVAQGKRWSERAGLLLLLMLGWLVAGLAWKGIEHHFAEVRI